MKSQSQLQRRTTISRTPRTNTNTATIASSRSRSRIKSRRNDHTRLLSTNLIVMKSSTSDDNNNNNNDAKDDDADKSLSFDDKDKQTSSTTTSPTPITTTTTSSSRRRWKRQWMVRMLTGQEKSTTTTTKITGPPLQRPKCIENVIQNSRFSSGGSSTAAFDKKGKINAIFSVWISFLLQLIPTWVYHLRPSLQMLVTLLIYLFHTAILTQHSIVFPFQLIPNNRGYFQSLGYDSLAGITTLLMYQYIRRNQQVEQSSSASTNNDTEIEDEQGLLLPSLVSSPLTFQDMPWKNIWKSKYSQVTSLLAFVGLGCGYFYTKYISLFWEDTLYQFARHVEWMTVSMHHSLTVLLGHTSWIVIGSIILYVLPRPQPFFNNNQQQQRSMWFTSYYQRSSTQKKKKKKKNDKNKDDDQSSSMIDDEKSTSISSTTTPTSLLSSIQQQQPTPDTVLTTTPTPTKQYKQWIGWVLGGYFVSCWCYNISDYVNSYLFPLSILEQAAEQSVVGQIINSNEIKASLVGYIAPCLTAPW
eukprot:CAMPEP_0170986334 /NCGR_PEP_ID=MMETSP0736-20130129/6021_1 /TAXON_ID=186038 /ORGANISM="Fragilariopsis kerguelensis, Strain L26-C5" /LENGTH=526 /DNA_ID=CAMNT_0011410451 /DNA_START=413 /DNA_END=1990 /DNA_ORIENTATION=+